MSRRPRRENLDDLYEKGESIEDRKRFAEDCIRLFFKDKKYFCGGPIPERELVSDFALQTFLRTEFDDRCFDFIHEHCLSSFKVDPEYEDATVPWEVHCLLGLLDDLKSLIIPKEHHPGMLLLYFKFCHGVKILPHPLL